MLHLLRDTFSGYNIFVPLLTLNTDKSYNRRMNANEAQPDKGKEKKEIVVETELAYTYLSIPQSTAVYLHFIYSYALSNFTCSGTPE